MGNHRKSRSAKLNCTLAIGATAIGFGALSAMTAPVAQADWWDLFGDPLGGSGSGDLNGNLSNNNLILGSQNGNGNTNQMTWGAGNNMNTQLNLFSDVTGGSAINNGNTAATGGGSTATASPTTT